MIKLKPRYDVEGNRTSSINVEFTPATASRRGMTLVDHVGAQKMSVYAQQTNSS